MRGVILVGTAVTRPDAIGSLFRIEPGGAWEQPQSLPVDTAVQAITPHPTEPDTVYVAARKGLFASKDAGATWSKLNAPEGVQYWSFLIHPENPQIMYAGTSPVGAVRSSDGGETWETCECDSGERYTMSFGSSRMMKLAFHPTNRDILYGVAEIHGMYLSTDAGKTWRHSNKGIDHFAHLPDMQNTELTQDGTEGMYDAHAVVTTPAAPDKAYYICRLGVFETPDQGETLRDLEVARFAPFKYTRDMKVNPADPKTFYACFSISSRSEAGAMYRSPDMGETWVSAAPDIAFRSTIMGFGIHANEPGGIVAVTRHGQVISTTDDGAKWDEKQLPSDAGDAFCSAIL